MKFSADLETSKLGRLLEEFTKNILDDEPIFVSDEANILDVSGAEPQELTTRISNYYGKTVSMVELRQPLWKLIRQLNAGRSASSPR
jgi:hypothetical protein